MPWNMPVYDTDNFSFGPGVLLLCPADKLPCPSEGSPTLPIKGDAGGSYGDFFDVGAVRSGAEFAITRERLEVFQGSPRTLVKQYVTMESVQLTVTGIEWNLTNLKYVLGSGIQDSGPPETFDFGGALDIDEVGVLFVHETPAGHTIAIRIWRAQGAAELTVTFGDDLSEFPFVFRALTATVNWDCAALPSGKDIFRITRYTPS